MQFKRNLGGTMHEGRVGKQIKSSLLLTLLYCSIFLLQLPFICLQSSFLFQHWKKTSKTYILLYLFLGHSIPTHQEGAQILLKFCTSVPIEIRKSWKFQLQNLYKWFQKYWYSKLGQFYKPLLKKGL